MKCKTLEKCVCNITAARLKRREGQDNRGECLKALCQSGYGPSMFSTAVHMLSFALNEAEAKISVVSLLACFFLNSRLGKKQGGKNKERHTNHTPEV